SLLLLIPPPPTPPLFPYTTLFRSYGSARSRCAGWHCFARPGDGGAVRPDVVEDRRRDEERRVGPDYDAPQHGDAEASQHLAAEEDRKSTRLNSSHVKISYAVFCLK